LPHVDLFCPSLDELRFMTSRAGDATALEDIHSLGRAMIDMGAAVVLLKLGGDGAALLTTDDPERLERLGGLRADPKAWKSVAIHQPVYDVDVVGATGAGDSTIAGFIAGLCEGQGPVDALNTAVAVGSLSVRAHDATSAIPPMTDVRTWLADATVAASSLSAEDKP